VVEVYKRTLLLSVSGRGHVNAREFHREAIEALNERIPWNLKGFISAMYRKKKSFPTSVLSRFGLT
jgi:hypothetical protein